MRYGNCSSSPFGAFPVAYSTEVVGSALERGGEEFLASIPSPEPRPDQVLENEQARKATRDFIRTLTLREQDLVERLFEDEQQQADIAEQYGVSRAAVNQMLHRICAKGAKVLAVHEPTADEYYIQPTLNHEALSD